MLSNAMTITQSPISRCADCGVSVLGRYRELRWEMFRTAVEVCIAVLLRQCVYLSVTGYPIIGRNTMAGQRFRTHQRNERINEPPGRLVCGCGVVCADELRWPRPPLAPGHTAAVDGVQAEAGQPASVRNDNRTCRSGLSTLMSTSAIDCHVPSASAPPSTGTVAYGAIMAGMTWERP